MVKGDPTAIGWLIGNRHIFKSSLITHYSSLITHYSSLITHYSMLITTHSLLITHHSLLITNHFLFPNIIDTYALTKNCLGFVYTN